MEKGFKDFLNLPENERLERLNISDLSLFQRVELWLVNKWWTSMVKQNKCLRPEVLWESLLKGRF